MAEIGHIKSVSTIDGQIVCQVESGSGPVVSAVLFESAGSEFYPMPGDRVLFHRTGQEIVITGVLAGDTETDRGQGLILSRNSAGNIVARILLDNTGRVTITPDNGVRIGNGSSPVTLASRNDAIWSALANACNAFAPPGTPDGGAALSSAIAGAISGAGGTPVNTGSSNLEAD